MTQCIEDIAAKCRAENWEHADLDYVQFAKMIIRECARIDSEANNPDHKDGVTYNQTILEHFGVGHGPTNPT